jgi:DNA-binding transcriptional regulator YhcF (GntR family)
VLLELNIVGDKPIYVQISEWLENEILCGNIKENEKIYSQYQLAEMFNINPATAAKGINILADQGILYKKRGLGMFLSTDAKEKYLDKYLGLDKGAVSPFGILNDTGCIVEVVVDKDILAFEHIGVPPNDNTATLWIRPQDLESIIRNHGNVISYIDV